MTIHLAHVPLDEHAGALDVVRLDLPAQQCRGVANHGQGIAQFVRDDRDFFRALIDGERRHQDPLCMPTDTAIGGRRPR